MKKYLLLLVMAVCLSVNAQTDHFKFMGIPITGSEKEFAAKLEANGFKKIEDHYTKKIDGRFVSVEFYVYSKTQKVNNVHMDLFFDNRESAEDAFQRYHDKFLEAYNDPEPYDPGNFTLEMADYDEDGESLGKVTMGIDERDGFYFLDIDFIDWEW
jgi:hypothetical protein